LSDQIEIPDGVGFYPPSKSIISDKPLRDSGNNFGRIGRVHELLGEWTNQSLSTSLAGIAAFEWVRFLKSHTESSVTYSYVANTSLGE